MRLSMFRGFFLGCLGLLALAFTAATPASAATEPIGLHVLIDVSDHQDFILAETHVAIAADHTQRTQQHARSSIDARPMHPVYDLSRRTYGQNLLHFHPRC